MQKLGRNKWVEGFIVFIAAILPLFVMGCGSKQSSPTFNISGGWYTFYATKGTAGETGPSLFTFTTTNSNLTGVTDKGQPINGSITGLDVSFTFVDSDGATNTSNGTVSGDDGSTMAGTWTKSNGQSGTWHAVIGTINPEVNLAGNWNLFQAETGGAEQALGTFIFTQSGFGIAGTTPDSNSVIGAIGRLDVTFFWTGSDGVTRTMTGIVTVDGNTISGTWYDTDGKSGTWRATRVS